MIIQNQEIKKQALRNYLNCLKAELDYSKIYFLGIVGVIALFWICAINDVSIESDSKFMAEYFWAGFISLAIYGFLLAIYLRIFKEKRDRFLIQLPNSVEGIIQQKITLVFLLLTIIIASIFLLKLFVSEDWNKHISGVLRQFGLFFTFLAALSIIIDFKSIFPKMSQIYFTILSVMLIVAVVTVQVFILIYWPEKLKIEEVAFLSWGTILIIISQLIQLFKKSYL